MNHQNNWREEEIGILISEAVVPERIFIQQKINQR